MNRSADAVNALATEAFQDFGSNQAIRRDRDTRGARFMVGYLRIGKLCRQQRRLARQFFRLRLL
ncbi:MAG TPA: hypothetical protein DCZ49_05425 [Hyphomonadaceae bacterium]|nr:hypothetical protein [Hyphomonadaceae bacterium]